MKKILFGIIALGLFASCDPSKDSIDAPKSISVDDMNSGFTFKQCALDENGNYVDAADGNFIFYESPRVCTIYRLNSSGGEVVMAKGASKGMFTFKPGRGSDPNQTFYVRARGYDGENVTIQRDIVLAVAGDLTYEQKLLCSNSGTKIWKWDTSFREDGAVWGNLGYTPGSADTFINEGNGIWWGCPPEDLTGQLQHSDTGVATGEEDSRAFMVFSEDGSITTFDAGGNQIRNGSFEVKNFDAENPKVVNDVEWNIGTLATDAGTILFPFKINGGGTKPTEFEIIQLTPSKLKLIYADAGTGGWSEATWWAFTSDSDGEGALNNYGEKAWTWDGGFREDGAVWGNLGYTPGTGDTFVNEGNGIWWGCPPEDLTGQLQHSDTGAATGEEDSNAYMVFDNEGQVTTYDAGGNKIRGGSYTINFTPERQTVNDVAWNFGTLETDAGSILFPFKINGGGTKPTSFQIMELTEEKMKLIYADEGTGGWSEATWWAFKKK